MRKMEKESSPGSSQTRAQDGGVQAQQVDEAPSGFNDEMLAAILAAEWRVRDGGAPPPSWPGGGGGGGMPPWPDGGVSGMYSVLDGAWGRGRQEAAQEDARVLAEEEAARRDREAREDAAAAGGGVGTKVTLDFGAGSDGKPRLLEVVDLGGGICCTGVDVLDVLRVVGIDPQGGGRGIRKYALSEKERAERTGRWAQEKRARQSADRESFPAYVEGLLKLLAVQPLGRAGWGASFTSGSALVGSVAKLVPVPHGWTENGGGESWRHSRDEDSGRSRQVLEKVDPASPSGVSESGLRVIIANAGRNASRRDVFPGAVEEARNGSGTWAVLSVPYGVIEQREAKLQRPDVMLGYQLAMATHVLSGSWEPLESELKLVNSLKDFASFETAPASLTEWAALGNRTALRDYLKETGQDPEGPLPPVRNAAVRAERFAENLAEAIAEGRLDEETWGPVLASVRNLEVTRAEAASITMRDLAEERGLPVLKSPAEGGANNSLWAQYELNVDPREITSAMAENPRQTAGETPLHNFFARGKPSQLGRKKYLWGGMRARTKFLGTLKDMDKVVAAALRDKGESKTERRAASAGASVSGLAVSALTGPVKLALRGMTITYRTGGYVGSRIEAGGKRNWETAQRNVGRAAAHPLVAVEGVGGLAGNVIKEVVAPLAKEVVAELMPGEDPVVEAIGEIVVTVTGNAVSTATDIPALRAAAEARHSEKALKALDRLEEIGNWVSRFRSHHLGVGDTSEPAALYRAGNFENWGEGQKEKRGKGQKRGVLQHWEGLEDLSEETETFEGAGQERVAAPAGDDFDVVHKANWSRCMSDWMSPDKEMQKTASLVMESVMATGGSISMEATGGEGALLAYDPGFGNGRGRAALAVGDMATAQYVAVLVPGMGSSLETLPELARHARHLHDECLRARPGAQVAVVAWMGYKAPRSPLAGNLKVAREESAEKGAELLRSDLDTWRRYWRQSAVRRGRNLPDQPQLTISGLSYGSVVAGHAAMAGAAPDNLVLLGSPGTGLRAQHLDTPSSNIFVAATDTDVVSMLDWFSIDPTHKKYGDVTRMKADYQWTLERGIVENAVRAHTSYYDPGTESLANISRVVVGKPEEVTREEQRTRAMGGGYRNVVGRAFTDSHEKSTVKSRRKRELTSAPFPVTQVRCDGFPVLSGSSTSPTTVSLGNHEFVAGKLFATYGVGFFVPDFMDIVTDNGFIELDTTWQLQPRGFRKDRVFVVRLQPDGNTWCGVGALGATDPNLDDLDAPYTEGKRLPFGLPKEGEIIVVALIPHSSTEVWDTTPTGTNKIKRSALKDLRVDPFPLSLATRATDLRLMKAIINEWEADLEVPLPIGVVRRMCDAVRDHFSKHPEQEAELSPLEKADLASVRKSYTEEAALHAFELAGRLGLFSDEPSASAGNLQQVSATPSGEVYLIDVSAKEGLTVQAKPGSGRTFGLDKTCSSFLTLPPGCNFRWTAAGGEVKCPPPLSATGDRLPILALFDARQGIVIDVISMDDEWHSIPLDLKMTRSEQPYIVIGAVVTSRSEKRAVPSGTEGRALEPYPADILTDENDQLNITENWFATLEQGAHSETDGSFDWRGLARSTDPLIGVLQDLQIPASSVPVARVMLKGMLETTESTPLTDAAKAVMTTGDEYIGSINRIRPFHRHVHPAKYADGRIPLDTEVIADFKNMDPTPWTVSYQREWRKAESAVRAAQTKFDEAVTSLDLELGRIEVPKKSPAKALNAAFLVMLAANLGVSVFGGGMAEGDALTHMVAAGSSIAVAMPLLQKILTISNKVKAARIVGKAAPFVSLFANLISLANNLRQDDIDEWSVVFDVMGLTADTLAILALAFPALAPAAGPLGLILAIPSVVYMIAHWGEQLPAPDVFVKDLGTRLLPTSESAIQDYRADFHQRLESFGVPYRRIAALWNTSEESSTSKVVFEQLEKELLASSLIDKGSWISIASHINIHSHIISELGLHDSFNAPTQETTLRLYFELMKYCVKKIGDTPADKRKDLSRSSFSLKDWASTEEAKPWLARFAAETHPSARRDNAPMRP
ncbi:alpha/beta hydrolase [Streptomyces sp. NPDC007861]|uniref:alpha/beta hydrolase n=1 Tax=Streptomyces sp. NPDC007861 TaxID=3154893 RepID=UPI0033DBFB3E